MNDIEPLSDSLKGLLKNAQLAPRPEVMNRVQTALRAFELLLLREIGLLPALDIQTMTLAGLEPQQRYVLVSEGGLREADAHDRHDMSGAQWQDLQLAMQAQASYTDALHACSPVVAAL